MLWYVIYNYDTQSVEVTIYGPTNGEFVTNRSFRYDCCAWQWVQDNMYLIGQYYGKVYTLNPIVHNHMPGDNEYQYKKLY